jgi:hypothetical protein
VTPDADEPGALAASPVRATDDGAGDVRPPEAATAAAWPDDTAEAAFLAEARERGEVPVPAKAREEIAEETDARPLPALEGLVQRLPAEVRETLEDLFRARFVRVTRVPRKALSR